VQLSRAWEQIRLEPKRRPRSEPRGARRRVLEAVTNPAAAVALTKVGPKTVNNHLGVLGSLFSAATRWGYCEVNLVRAVRRVRTRIGTIRAEPSFSLRASARLRGSDS